MNRIGVSIVSICLSLTLVLSIGVAQAGVVISIVNTQFTPTQIGFVDVFIRSDANDTLSNFAFNFRIDPVGATSTQLQFSDPQSDLQLLESNYVFAAGSLKRDGDPSLLIAPESVGNVFTDIFPNDSYVGTDSFTLLAPASVSLTSSNLLLARLELTPGPGLLAPVVGDQFTISLVDGPFTTFLDENLNAISYSSNVGTVNITAVPEPSAFWLLLVAGLVISLSKSKRKLFLIPCSP